MANDVGPLIRIEGLHHTYQQGTGRAITAVRGVDLTINAGEYVALIGANGSGKSTLLRHCNALLLPTVGDVWVAGCNTRDPANTREIRTTAGMVFQVPDTQIVATVVEEDVAFGPENLGLAEEELKRRVDWALATVGLMEIRQHASHLLSAGQKQRLAIASALAMHPRCLLLDEATSVLDPAGRRHVLETVRKLHEDGMTIVSATHDMSEAAEAQRIVVLSEGRVALDGEPRAVFSRAAALRVLQLDVPYPTALARRLAECVPGFPVGALSVNELVDAIALRLETSQGAVR